MKFLLSTGKSTDKLEYYIIDLLKLYLNIVPGDIPGAPTLGFNFIMTDTFKSNLEMELKNRVLNLISRIQKRFDSKSVEISLKSLELVNDSQAKLEISVNKLISDEIILNLYE